MLEEEKEERRSQGALKSKVGALIKIEELVEPGEGGGREAAESQLIQSNILQPPLVYTSFYHHHHHHKLPTPFAHKFMNIPLCPPPPTPSLHYNTKLSTPFFKASLLEEKMQQSYKRKAPQNFLVFFFLFLHLLGILFLFPAHPCLANFIFSV